MNGDYWDYSWNVAPGCTKVGPECANCWALRMAKRLQGMKKRGYEGLVDWRGNWSGKVNLLNWRLDEPMHLRRPRVIAVNLMGDLFHEKIDEDFIRQTFLMMCIAKQNTYMVLTKRPERFIEFIRRKKITLPNVRIGTTAGTQRSANERWSAMALIAQAGWNTWMSCEPQLERIDWHGWGFLKWMVAGGESGSYARPTAPAWVRTDRDWCQEHGVAFWFKQWGEWGPGNAEGGMQNDESQYPMTTIGGEMVFRFGRKLAGRILDGRTWEDNAA